MSLSPIEKESLKYHKAQPPGKTETGLTTELETNHDLALAYSPGVAGPCKEIESDPEAAKLYTGKQNLVAVISDGTAVLGLGNIGPLASKPVMEGKAVLFKKFAGVNAFDIEVDSRDVDHFIDVVAALEPTFGGINLEDIKAPECFYIEKELQKKMNIPVFHDDQHGTAIVTMAALVNACEIQNKELKSCKIAISGAGSSAIATAKLLIAEGVPYENIHMCDTSGVIYEGRDRVNEHKEPFALKTDKRTLSEAIAGSDVFIGMSVKDLVSKEMLCSMSPNPIVLALANPDPEIKYEEAIASRDDLIIATGRSDHPNQVNNVLGFPFIFKGALSVHSSKINTRMKRAAYIALAKIAKQKVPQYVLDGYGLTSLSFGKEYILPKPMDKSLSLVALAVADAALDSGLGKVTEEYDKLKAECESLSLE